MGHSASVRGRWRHGEGLGTHRHAHGQLVYPATGTLAVTTQRGTRVAQASRVMWTPPGCDHRYRACGRTEVRALFLPASLSRCLPEYPAVFTVSELLRAVLMTATEDREFRPGAWERLRDVVIDELADAPEESLYLPELRDDRLRAVAGLLHDDPANTDTLGALGRCVGASERTLSRLFDAELGMSFHQWRTQLRIQHALTYLGQGRSVTDTAISCGWSNPSSFIDAFASTFGMTPGRYQKELHDKNSRAHRQLSSS